MNGFESWYRAAHPRLVTSLVAFCGDAERGRDAADEAATRALERWDRVSIMDSPDGWALRTGFNVLRRRARRAKLERALLRRSAPAGTLHGPAGELWAMVADLPTRQRQAVVLRHVAQMTEPEIARVMGVARGTVSSSLRSAYTSLRLQIVEPTPAQPDDEHTDVPEGDIPTEREHSDG